MATSMAHVVMISHVAWNNHATPLWTTLALWLTALAFSSPRPGATGKGTTGERTVGERNIRARTTAERWALTLAGALWGVALASHPSAAAPLAGACAWALAAPERRRMVLSSQGASAVLALTLVVSPLVIHSIRQPFAYLKDAFGTSQPVEREGGPGALVANAVGLAAQLGRAAAAGPLVEPGDPLPAFTYAVNQENLGSTSQNAAVSLRATEMQITGVEAPLVAIVDGLRTAATMLYATILLAALLWSLAGGSRLLATTALVGLVSLPVFNRSYTNFYDARYLGYVLPLAYTALALVLTQWLWPSSPDSPISAPRRGRLARAVVMVAVAMFALYPLMAANAYYLREVAAGRTNRLIPGGQCVDRGQISRFRRLRAGGQSDAPHQARRRRRPHPQLRSAAHPQPRAARAG